MAGYTGTEIMQPHQFGGISAALNSSEANQNPQSPASVHAAQIATIATTTANQAARKSSMPGS